MTLPFRYEKLGYAALNVTDLDRSIPFYQGLMGLDLVSRDEGVAYLRCSRDHHNLVLYAAQTPGLKRVAFKMLTQADLKLAFEHFQASGLEPRWLSADECRALQQGPTFRVREPSSTVLLEFYDRMVQMALPYEPTHTKIARIGHVVLATKHYPEAMARLSSVFNFTVSDFVEDKFSWMRCHPNPLHHSLAVGYSETNHLHHINFMVTDVDDVGKALNRMRDAGVEIVFGPGRHLPSTSLFLYFLDPDGMSMEYSFGMEEFPEQNPREPRMLEMHPRTMDIWGSRPSERFGRGGNIEGVDPA
jgi:2,3-dihydroxy-p-cumate/2,3-dihydroxybenzoate 3,4-dioxygenase